MNKRELVEAVHSKTEGYELDEIDALVTLMLKEMTKTIASGEKLMLRGFGTFDSKERAGYETYGIDGNVNSVESMKVVTFKPGKALKDRLNRRN